MNALERKEIEGIRQDRESGNALMEQKMDNFARELKNGLGDRMIEDLRNPSNRKVETGFKYRFKQWKKRIIENLKYLFYS